MRTLVLDIETAPHLGWVWSLWDQNVGLSQIEQVGSVICWAAKWTDEPRVQFASDFHDGHETMLQQVWELLDEADAVVGYNSKNFDLKHLAREFVVAGMPPPSPWQDVDLMLAVKRRFKFASNKLDHVAGQLGLGGKLAHSGFELWRGCIEDDPKAWATMKRYNIQDVKLTQQLWERLTPWLPAGVNRALDGVGCPRCGHDDLMRRGTVRTPLAEWQTLQCKACKGYSRASTAERRAQLRAV
jgi:DNA polymerase elongation subunit (family B)